MCGNANATSLIENCSATNVTVGNAKRTGGLIGKMVNTTVRNCYLTGQVNAGSDGSGGLIGEALNGTTVENCYVKVNTNFAGTSGSIGGVIGNPVNTILKNTVSMARSISGDAHGFRVNGTYTSDIHKTLSSNNYELATSNLKSNTSKPSISEVTEETLQTSRFYKEILGWDNGIWDLDNIEQGKYPTLRGADPNYVVNTIEKPLKQNIYIPNYSILKKLPNYEENKEIAYHNLYKLMPYYDSKYLLVDGSKIAEDDILNKKLIKKILPYDKQGNLAITLTQDNNQNLEKIKIIFEDNSTKDYFVTFEEVKGYVASYKINENKIMYNFNKFIIKQDAKIVEELIQYINEIDYTNDLDSLTQEEDSRLYRDHYNEQIKTNSRDFVLKYLQYNKENIVTIENNILNTKIKQELTDTSKLKEILYGYNYYKRWYNIDIKGCNVADIMLFEGELFEKNMTFENLINEVLAASSGERRTGNTHSFYTNRIKKYTKIQYVEELLDYIVATIGGYENTNDWFTENYQGIVYEIPAKGYPDVDYRAWSIIRKRKDKYFLPLMTLPENSAYIVSSPTQYLIGAQTVYIADPSDATQREGLLSIIRNYAVQIGNFYTTAAGFVEADRLNASADIQIDRRITIATPGGEEAGKTQDPFHKNFNEAVGDWAAHNGSAAYAWGSSVNWVAYSALTSFSTWSHESGHNQDSKVFLKGLRT